jgi:IPT/TIG domain/Right handed beta helix region
MKWFGSALTALACVFVLAACNGGSVITPLTPPTAPPPPIPPTAPPPSAPTITGFSPGSGAVGDTITVSGTHLSGATSVRFNVKPATIAENTDTSLKVNVPIGASSGKIALTTPVGTATSSTNFTLSVTYAAPITITKGGTYTGAWESTDADTPAVKVETSEPVVIENCRIRSAGEGISSYSQRANLTVRGCIGEGLTPSVAGKRKGAFVAVGVFESVVVENNLEDGFGLGVRALNYGPDVTKTGQRLIVRYNIFRNVDGRTSDGQGGYSSDPLGTSGNAVGLNTLRSANVEIAWNEIINQPRKSRAEDIISTFESSGTSANPIHIHDNYVQGGYAADPAALVNYSGCGMQIGDAPNKDDVGYTHIHDNQVINFENCGIGLSAGHDNEIDHNRIVSARTTPDGTIVLGGNYRAGLGLWDYYFDLNLNCKETGNPLWRNNSMHDNEVNVVNRNGTATGNIFCSAYGTNTQTNNVNSSGRLATNADERAEYERWQTKLKDQKIKLGP